MKSIGIILVLAAAVGLPYLALLFSYRHVSPSFIDPSLTADIRARLASSTHYLRYFIFGGFVAFLVQVPALIQNGPDITRYATAYGAAAISFLCLIMDWRNYGKYRALTDMRDSSNRAPTPGPVTIFLSLFYLSCFFYFFFFVPIYYLNLGIPPAKTTLLPAPPTSPFPDATPVPEG